MTTEPQPIAYSQKIALAMMRRIIARGQLRIAIAGHGDISVGEGGDTAGMTLPPLRTLSASLILPDPRFLDGYVNGEWECIGCEIEDLLYLLAVNLRLRPRGIWQRLADAGIWLQFRLRQFSSVGTSKRRVSHHYDIGNDLYLGFLDKKTAQYTCAFFDENHADLDSAQENKMNLTLTRLGVADNMSVLDIGCGWGGLTREIVRRFPAANVAGITLSHNQIKHAEAERLSLPSADANRLHYELCDYRRYRKGESAVYDRIVSIGMFEQVGLPQHDGFFRTARRLLKADGKLLLHTIARPLPGFCSPWVDRNIFPGGYIPSVSQILSAAEKAGFSVLQIFCHAGENYQKTLKAWRENYRRIRNDLPSEKYDERFHRIWEMYYAASIYTFDSRLDGYQVMQFLFCRREFIC